jgi:hypothetical protein
MRYLALEPPNPLRTMFDEVPEWSMRHEFDRAVALRVCRMLLRDRPLMRGGPLLSFYLDERPLAPEDVRILDDRAQLQLEIPDSSQAPSRIGWVCSAHHAPGDHRTLGVPVTSLTWIRDDATAAGSTAPAPNAVTVSPRVPRRAERCGSRG